MTNIDLPDPLMNVMITYNKVFRTGPYGDTPETRTITKMGFYDGGKFHIPPGWQHFRMSGQLTLLPDGFGGDHLTSDRIIKWEPIKQ